MLSFGEAAIDGALPAGGLGPGLHEVVPGGADLPDEAAATQMTAYLLGRLDKPVVWVLRGRFLFAPGLAEMGLSPHRLLYAEAGSEGDVLAVAEEALRHGGLAGVVVEAHRLSLKASRRLQLAAEASQTPCLALRLRKRGCPPSEGTACVSRWGVSSRPSCAPDGLPRASWRLDLTRCRGGAPRSWNVELQGGENAQAPLRLRLAAELAGSAAGAAAGQGAA